MFPYIVFIYFKHQYYTQPGPDPKHNIIIVWNNRSRTKLDKKKKPLYMRFLLYWIIKWNDYIIQSVFCFCLSLIYTVMIQCFWGDGSYNIIDVYYSFICENKMEDWLQFYNNISLVTPFAHSKGNRRTMIYCYKKKYNLSVLSFNRYKCSANLLLSRVILLYTTSPRGSTNLCWFE